MKKHFLFLIFFALFANVCYSQNDNLFYESEEDFKAEMAKVKPNYRWMGTVGRMVADDMKLKYHKPKGFYQDGSSECFDEYPKLWATFTCMGPQLHSKDGQFISFLVFPRILTEEIQESQSQVFPQLAGDWVDKQHYQQMRAKIRNYYGEGIGESWRDSITAYSAEDTHRKFNADSAFTFTLHLRPADYYKKDFKHVKVLLIQREGRGYAYICSFYTDKAKAKFDKYWRRIEKTLSYKD